VCHSKLSSACPVQKDLALDDERRTTLGRCQAANAREKVTIPAGISCTRRTSMGSWPAVESDVGLPASRVAQPTVQPAFHVSMTRLSRWSLVKGHQQMR